MSEPYEEHRWVPIAQSGERWAERSLEAALSAAKEYPAGGRYADGAEWDGVTHIVHEVRTVTAWEQVPPTTTHPTGEASA